MTDVATMPVRQASPKPSVTAGKYEGVAVLVPCYNEAVTVGKVVDDFKAVLPGATIYVFDNNSKDRTAEIAREHGAIVVTSPRQGKGHVVQHMFDQVEADCYLMVDGDDTYPAAAAPALIDAMRASDADMIVGSRLTDFKSGSFRRFHSFGNHLVARLISFFFRMNVTDVLSGYRVFSRDFVKTVPLMSEGFDIETEFTLQAAAKSFKVVEVPISYGVRPEGSHSKLNTFKDGILILKVILRIFKDYKPQVFFTAVAVFLAMLSLAAGITPIMDYVREQFVHHVPLAVLAAGLGILSVLSMAVGLILDTVNRYHNESFRLWRKQLRK